MNSWNEELFYDKRCLRTREGKLLFGPCGDRLAVDILDPQPGFRGCIDFIHKMNITELFTVECSERLLWDEMDVMWYPTYMTMSYESEKISFRERKTIVAQDIAVSLMCWENKSDKNLRLALRSQPEGFTDSENAIFDAQTIGSSETYAGILKESGELRFGIRIGIATYWNWSVQELIVRPKECVTLYVASAVGNLMGDMSENIDELSSRTVYFLENAQKRGAQAAFEELLADNRKFYEAAPRFICDDRAMNACWKYRWYILKNSMCRPQMGRFQGTVMYEGRDHRMRKTPLSPYGWEFSKLIPLSTPLQVTDLRWHPFHKITKEIIQSAFAAQDEDGLILSAYVEGEQKSYANYMIYAIWQHYLVEGDKHFLEGLLPAMERYISGHEKCYGNDKDGLLIERTHALTGKEYQPSYWYFKGFLELGRYPDNPKDKTYFTPLKRVDRSAYHYLNLMALSNIMRVLGKEKEKIYLDKAQRVKKDILEKMWDSETGYFYDLHYETDEKAMVRNIVGIYPFWAQMTQEEHNDGILPLIDREAFHTGSGFSTVSKDCPVFSPDGGWKGNYFKGRNGCVWCGPSWPYTTGIALEALGLESQKRGHIFDSHFDELLTEYTGEHFRDKDWRRPYLVEHYNPISGERLSDEVDYNHSFWLDIVVRFVAGVTVEEECVKIEPLATHLSWWRLTQLQIRGHKLDITCSEQAENGKRLHVCVDDEREYETNFGDVLYIKL